MSVLIISYCDKIRTNAHYNHFKYAKKHGYDYIYDISPTVHEKYYGKIEKILSKLHYAEWIFWLDDDAYFMDYNVKLHEIISNHVSTEELLFCAPSVRRGKFTTLSSGNFFLKNTPSVRQYLEKCLSTPLDEVKAWWDEEKHGIFTNGDLDIMVYHLFKEADESTLPKFKILPYQVFNSRPEHYPSESPFVVHFTGSKKFKLIKEFAIKHGLEKDLSPIVDYRIYCNHRPAFEFRHPRVAKMLKMLKIL